MQQLPLKAASTVGITFSIAAVAACLNQPAEVIEDQCAVLANRGQFLLERGAEVWPDGTISTCYQFRHALYRDVFYARLATGQRIPPCALAQQRPAARGPRRACRPHRRTNQWRGVQETRQNSVGISYPPLRALSSDSLGGLTP